MAAIQDAAASLLMPSRRRSPPLCEPSPPDTPTSQMKLPSAALAIGFHIFDFMNISISM
jgi:hypothetical protein